MAHNCKRACSFGRRDEDYILDPELVKVFKRDGLAILPDLLTEDEISEIETVYDKFMNREIHVPGKDFCDMSKPYSTPFEEWSIVNCMLPTRYYPQFAQNIFERLAGKIAAQLFPDVTMVKDYDQLLNKRSGKRDAVFGWHQDMAYWPPPNITRDTRTVTFSLAIDETTEENGCIRYVPGSQKSQRLRRHAPLGANRDDAHAVRLELDADDVVKLAPCRRGSATIHDEYVVHGSGGNASPGQRRTYVLALRTSETVAKERAIGFTHSHNDKTNWDNWSEAATCPPKSSSPLSSSKYFVWLSGRVRSVRRKLELTFARVLSWPKWKIAARLMLFSKL